MRTKSAKPFISYVSFFKNNNTEIHFLLQFCRRIKSEAKTAETNSLRTHGEKQAKLECEFISLWHQNQSSLPISAAALGSTASWGE